MVLAQRECSRNEAIVRAGIYHRHDRILLLRAEVGWFVHHTEEFGTVVGSHHAERLWSHPSLCLHIAEVGF